MTTVDGLRDRITELNAHSYEHRQSLRSARVLMNDGDLSGAEAIIDTVEQAMHPAGGGSGVPPSGFVSQSTPGQPLNLTVADGLGSGLTLPLGDGANVKDPTGLLNTETVDYYGTLYEPGNALILGPGVWAYSILSYWEDETTGLRMAVITNIDERIEQSGQELDPWLGDPNFALWPQFSPDQVEASKMTDKGAYRDSFTGGVVRVASTYPDAPFAFYVAQTSGAPRTLIGFTVAVQPL